MSEMCKHPRGSKHVKTGIGLAGMCMTCVMSLAG